MKEKKKEVTKKKKNQVINLWFPEGLKRSRHNEVQYEKILYQKKKCLRKKSKIKIKRGKDKKERLKG